MLVDGMAVDVQIDDGRLIVDDWDFVEHHHIKINYCPICGEKLGDTPEQRCEQLEQVALAMLDNIRDLEALGVSVDELVYMPFSRASR